MVEELLQNVTTCSKEQNFKPLTIDDLNKIAQKFEVGEKNYRDIKNLGLRSS